MDVKTEVEISQQNLILIAQVILIVAASVILLAKFAKR